MKTNARTLRAIRTRTTLRLDEHLKEQAKFVAAKRGETLTALMEQGLRWAIAQDQKPRKAIKLHVATTGGGLLPGIDLNNSAQLSDILDGLD